MKREMRASAIAGIAGVGAVVDVGRESFVIPGLGIWRQNQLRVIDMQRLSGRLHKVLKAPREPDATLMVRRFPRAMFCEKCRRIAMWKTAMERENEEPSCLHPGCGGTLVGMRFVVACENGHLDDIPWAFWAHSGEHGNRDCRVKDKLLFLVSPGTASAGLATLVVRCEACGARRSLEDITNSSITREMFRCTGRHPWIPEAAECEAEPVVLQRGATNLHYPSTLSALDIPRETSGSMAAEYAEQVRAAARYERLLSCLPSIEGMDDFIELLADTIAGSVGCTPEVVMEVARSDAEGRPLSSPNDAAASPLDQDALLEEEWHTLDHAWEAGGVSSANFTAATEELAETAPAWMRSLIRGVLLLRRLREVRAYVGFQRVRPGPADKTVPPDVGHEAPWLPAAEVYGEGVVLLFDFDRLASWSEAIPAEELEKLGQLEQKRIKENFWFLPSVDPVFLMLHTFSHLLIRRLTFECGYSSSSLRERIYFSRANCSAGIMIYTADGDSEGSLGGLVRQGRRDRLAQSILEAMDQGRWCSSDPVCSETAGQGLGGFNHAACHACSLISETSCTAANTLLDRRMLFDPTWGLLPFLESNG